MISKIIIIFGVLMSSFSWFVSAQNTILTDYVTDTTQTLSSDQLFSLNQEARSFSLASWSQIATLIIPERNGRELYDIALETFRGNGVGQKDNDNGVLLIIALQERKLRVMVWYGLEGALPDVFLKQLIERDLRPLLNSWYLYETVKTYQDQIIQAIQHESFTSPEKPIDNGTQFIFWFMLGYRLFSFLTGWLTKKDIEKALHRPWSYIVWGGGIVWLMIALGIGLILGYIGFVIGWLLAALYRNPHVSSFDRDHRFYGWRWGSSDFSSWFDWFGWWFSWWWGAWD